MSSGNFSFRVRILKILLAPPHGTDLSIRELAKKLDTTSSHVFYYLQKMCEEGILTKETEGDKGFYKPQPIFGRDIAKTLRLLNIIGNNVDETTSQNLANCISLFLKLHDSEDFATVQENLK